MECHNHKKNNRQTAKNKNKYRKIMVSTNARNAKKKLELFVTQGKVAEIGEYCLINIIIQCEIHVKELLPR